MYHSGYGGEDMYVVVTYDVHRKRCAKVMKYLRQWLEHRQRSVFAGFLTESQVRIMYDGLSDLINVKYDSVIVFQSNRANQVSEWTTIAARENRNKGVTYHLRHDPGEIKSRQKKAGKKKKFRFTKRKSV
ncbi:MAG: CRISPR-associated endonuclease Cas2 [Cyclonatronaceae bacterium]